MTKRQTFKVGDSVVVKPNTKDPDNPQQDIGGWQGRVQDIDFEDGTLFVEWDSVTLRNMPDELIVQSDEEELDWSGKYLTADELETAQPRDAEADVETALQEIFERHGWEIADISQMDLSEALSFFFEMEDDGEEEYYEPFDLETFYRELAIPEADQKLITDCLTIGLETYYHFIYGYDKYGKRPFFLIPERMHEPYIFGFGAVEVVRNQKISLESRYKVAQYTLQTVDPSRDYGVPNGIIILLSFVATLKVLPIDTFRAALQVLELAGDRERFRGWQKEEAIHLSDWLLTQEEMPDEEKLWWLSHLTVNLDYLAHVGKPMVAYWLAHDALSADMKQQLTWSWLLNEPRVGQPPAVWRLMNAQFSGDHASAAEALTELGVDPQSVLPPEEEMPKPPEFFDMLLGMRFGGFVLIPKYVRRLSVSMVVELGEDPYEICQMVLGSEYRDYDRDAMLQGAADVVEGFHERLTKEQVHEIVEKGLEVGTAVARKQFFQIGAELIDKNYLQRALQDNAKSVRNWAKKQIAKG